MDFIFMLTNHDATVPHAVEVYESIRSTGLRMVGFKDVGASPDTLRRLTDTMHEDGRTVFLEVVSTGRGRRTPFDRGRARVGSGRDHGRDQPRGRPGSHRRGPV